MVDRSINSGRAGRSEGGTAGDRSIEGRSVRPTAIDAPEVSDKSSEAATGRTLREWFAHLDAQGGVAEGRRDLVTHLYSPQELDEWWATTVAVEYDKDGRSKGYSICSTKSIAAPVVAVFAAWQGAKQLDLWLGPKTKIDFQDGGAFSSADGDRGTFPRIGDRKDLRFTWNHASRATGSHVEALSAGTGKGTTGVTLNHTRIHSRRDADELRDGRSSAFDALTRVVEGA